MSKPRGGNRPSRSVDLGSRTLAEYQEAERRRYHERIRAKQAATKEQLTELVDEDLVGERGTMKRSEVDGGGRLSRSTPREPQSRAVLSVRVRVCRFDGEPLTGRQRDWCSAKCRMAAKRAEADPGAGPVTNTTPKQRKRPGPAAAPPTLGRREPTYSLIPKHTSSKGPEAVELMCRAGLELDGWQQDVLEAAMGRSKGRWSASEAAVLCPRQNGKSEIAEAVALWTATSGPKKLVIVSSHETKTNEELFLRMRDVVETPAFEEYAPKIYTANGRESITFSNGSRIKFIARSKHQGRGFSADLIIIDEAFILSDASWSSLKPSLAAAKQPQLWLISSAPHPDSDVLRRYCLRGRAGKDKDLAYFEWSAPLDAAPDSYEAWAASNPALGRISLETVASELKALDPEAFGRERLGQWREDETPSVFPPDVWEALAFLGPLETTGTTTLAVDVSPTRDSAAIAAGADIGQGRALIEIVAVNKGTSWIIPKLSEIAKSHPNAKIVIDKMGPAASLAEELRSAGLSVHETNAGEFANACAGLFDSVLAGTVIHRGDPVLDQAVQNAEMRPLGDRFAWKRRTAAGDISPLVAASLALHGVRALPQPKIYIYLPDPLPRPFL